MPRPISKYGAFVRSAAQQTMNARGALLGRLGFFTILLLVFSRLWLVAFHSAGQTEVDARNMLWYLAITEWMALGLPLLYLDFEADIRSGAIAYLLCRPISYVGMRLAEGVGQLLVRLVFLGVTGFALTRFFTGGWPAHLQGLVLAVPLVAFSCLVSLVYQAAIGLSAFWLQDASPAYWIWQKATFILGGLLLPLSLYPPWLQKIAFATPFSALLYGPARAAVSGNLQEASHTALLLLFWGAVGALSLAFVYSRARRVVEVHGG